MWEILTELLAELTSDTSVVHKDLEKYHYYLLLNGAGCVKLIAKTELVLQCL